VHGRHYQRVTPYRKVCAANNILDVRQQTDAPRLRANMRQRAAERRVCTKSAYNNARTMVSFWFSQRLLALRSCFPPRRFHSFGSLPGIVGLPAPTHILLKWRQQKAWRTLARFPAWRARRTANAPGSVNALAGVNNRHRDAAALLQQQHQSVSAAAGTRQADRIGLWFSWFFSLPAACMVFLRLDRGLPLSRLYGLFIFLFLAITLRATFRRACLLRQAYARCSRQRAGT